VKKGILYLGTGLIMGLALSVAVPVFGAAKQYVLTLFDRPVIVNGKAYNDSANPILNHNGKTYIPLAKIGELTGVQYKWNADKKQVEIGAVTKANTSGTSGPAGRENDYLKPDTVIEKEAQKGYKGYADEADSLVSIANMKGEPGPPRLSEGWIRESLLSSIHGIGLTGTSTVYYFMPSNISDKELLKITVPADWEEKGSGELKVDGIRIIKYSGNNYYNISDLEKAGVIK